MTENAPETGHHGTFEVAPAENVAGQKVQLVYTRVKEGMSSADRRTLALQCAVTTEDRNYLAESDDDNPTAKRDRILDTAAAYLAFIEAAS